MRRRGANNRSVLKVYMANQLDEAQMEEYEDVVNELARELDEATKTRDELTENISLLHNEKDEYISIKSKEQQKDKERKQYQETKIV